MKIFGIVITTRKAIDAECYKRNRKLSTRYTIQESRVFELIKENSRLKSIILESGKR